MAALLMRSGSVPATSAPPSVGVFQLAVNAKRSCLFVKMSVFVAALNDD